MASLIIITKDMRIKYTLLKMRKMMFNYDNIFTPNSNIIKAAFSIDIDWHKIPYLAAFSKQDPRYEEYLNTNPLRFAFNRCGSSRVDYYCYFIETSTGYVYDAGLWKGAKDDIAAWFSSGDFINHIEAYNIKNLKWQFSRYADRIRGLVNNGDYYVTKVIIYNSINSDELNRLNVVISNLLHKQFSCMVVPSPSHSYELKVSLLGGRTGTIAHCDNISSLVTILGKYAEFNMQKTVNMLVNSKNSLKALSELASMKVALDYIFLDSNAITADCIRSRLSNYSLIFWTMEEYCCL